MNKDKERPLFRGGGHRGGRGGQRGGKFNSRKTAEESEIKEEK